jgi:two-component system, chemotaxis family, chemotaxis protein CheY
MPIIALVDDDAVFQFTATRLIESTKLAKQILKFDNGGEALKYLRENTQDITKLPDFLFLDINMPFVDGWMFLDDFIKFKSSLAKEIKIYMVSSSIDPRDMNRAKNFIEIKDFVVKPVTLEMITNLLKKTS